MPDLVTIYARSGAEVTVGEELAERLLADGPLGYSTEPPEFPEKTGGRPNVTVLSWDFLDPEPADAAEALALIEDPLESDTAFIDGGPGGNFIYSGTEWLPLGSSGGGGDASALVAAEAALRSAADSALDARVDALEAVGRSYVGGVRGALTTQTGTARIYNDSGTDYTIVSIRASVGVAPTGDDVIVDVHKNGTTIFTTQGNRPTVSDGENTSGKVTNMDVTSLSDGDYLTVDIDQVGSTVAGEDLVVQIEVA